MGYMIFINALIFSFMSRWTFLHQPSNAVYATYTESDIWFGLAGGTFALWIWYVWTEVFGQKSN